jgi:hypothetical protein
VAEAWCFLSFGLVGAKDRRTGKILNVKSNVESGMFKKDRTNPPQHATTLLVLAFLLYSTKAY